MTKHVESKAAEEPINWPEAVVNCEWRIGVLEQIIDHLIAFAPEGTITPKKLEDWRREALAELRIKYPKAGLERTKRIVLPENLAVMAQKTIG